jgi:hypothetical protein
MFLFIGGISLTSCSNSGSATKPESKTEEAHAHKHYQCPMKCEKDKVYGAEGKCPVCKMDLKEIEA